jgi:hypothetical protein
VCGFIRPRLTDAIFKREPFSGFVVRRGGKLIAADVGIQYVAALTPAPVCDKPDTVFFDGPSMNVIWEYIQHQLATNQFFGGGLILMIAGGVVAYFREVPARIWIWMRGRWVIEIDVLDREPAFDWIDR